MEDKCWINIYPPFNHNEMEALSQKLEVPIDFMLDSLDVNERSRFEREDNAELIVLNAPIKTEGDPNHDALYITAPIGIISVGDIIITISSFQNPIIDYFLKKNLKDFDPIKQKDFVLRIFDKTIYYFLVYLKKINHLRNQYQKELYDSSRNDELLKMMNLQKSLVYFATTLRDNEQLIKRIQRTDFIHVRDNEDLSDFLDDIIIDNSQAREMADIYNNILNGTLDTFASIISNNLNNVMKRLTSVTIVLMVPTLVASFYGMNVSLPFADSPHAYILSIVVSILFSLIVVYFFRRNRIF